MRLFLIRHAVTPETGKRLSSRDHKIPLSPAGKTMAADLGKHLAPVSFDAIYTSPMTRCRETAAAVASGRNIRPITNEAFTEADFGKWLGRPLNSVYKLKAWQELMTSASRFRFPDGGTLGELQRKAVAGVEELTDRHKKQTIAVASHADTIRVILSHYLGAPLDLVHRLDVRPASFSIVDLFPSGGVRVPVVNQVAGSETWR